MLVIDDDAGTRETFDWALRAEGMQVRATSCGATGIRLAKAEPFDVWLVDLELPDMRGTDVVRALRAHFPVTPFVLISAFLTTDATVSAMRLGAFDVLDKPVSVDDLPVLVRNAVLSLDEGRQPCSAPRTCLALVELEQSAQAVSVGRSSADRWVANVLRGCLAVQDPKTLKYWAEEIGVSYTTLRESCTVVGIAPHDARNLMRMLRVVLHKVAYGSPLDTLLDTGDVRTLAELIEIAGFKSVAELQNASVSDLFRRQQFVPNASPALALLRELVLQHLDNYSGKSSVKSSDDCS